MSGKDYLGIRYHLELPIIMLIMKMIMFMIGSRIVIQDAIQASN